MKRNTTRNLLLAIVLASVPLPASAQAPDSDAALALAKKGNCLKCHAIDKRKKAPSYMEIAAKYKAKADSEDVLLKHITGKPVVKLEEGDEPHTAPPTNDDGELRNLVRWILTR